ncbi:unnamed protein product, partial [Rotaria magnacalcarata]
MDLFVQRFLLPQLKKEFLRKSIRSEYQSSSTA